MKKREQFSKKITLSKEFYSKFINDMVRFNLNEYMSNNEFYNLAIINTYRYSKEIKSIETIKRQLEDKDNVLASNSIISSIKKNKSSGNPLYQKELTEVALLINSMLNTRSTYNEKDKFTFTIRETSKTEGKLSSIVLETVNIASSDIFKGLIYDYMSYPSYMREMILFLDNYNTLIKNRKNNIASRIETNNSYKYEFLLHRIVPDLDDLHFYAVGLGGSLGSNSSRKPMCFKLSTINAVVESPTSYELTKEEINMLNLRIKNNPAWIRNDLLILEVRLDAKGVDKYNSIKKDRPYLLSHDEENNIYTFESSYNQFFNYFSSFGSHFKILNNKKIEDIFIKFYNNALDAHNKN